MSRAARGSRDLVLDKPSFHTCHLTTTFGVKQKPYFSARRLDRKPSAIEPIAGSRHPSSKRTLLRKIVAIDMIK
jgi:hypothetical protein